MTYDPVSYWQERGRDYRFTRDRHAEFECIRRALEGVEPRSVLEVGAGWGHVYRHLRKHDSPMLAGFRMCDFVESMCDGCERETGTRPDLWDGNVLPYPDGSFDAVLSAACLQHVPPADLDTVFAEHVRVARRWLFVSAFVASGRKLPDTTLCTITRRCSPGTGYRSWSRGISIVDERLPPVYGCTPVGYWRNRDLRPARVLGPAAQAQPGRHSHRRR